MTTSLYRTLDGGTWKSLKKMRRLLQNGYSSGSWWEWGRREQIWSNWRDQTTYGWRIDTSIRGTRCHDVCRAITVVSGRLNVVKGLNEQIKLSVLEEVDIWLACRESQSGFIWPETTVGGRNDLTMKLVSRSVILGIDLLRIGIGLGLDFLLTVDLLVSHSPTTLTPPLWCLTPSSFYRPLFSPWQLSTGL